MALGDKQLRHNEALCSPSHKNLRSFYLKHAHLYFLSVLWQRSRSDKNSNHCKDKQKLIITKCVCVILEGSPLDSIRASNSLRLASKHYVHLTPKAFTVLKLHCSESLQAIKTKNLSTILWAPTLNIYF